MARRFNPPGESVWLEALLYRLRYLPIRTLNNLRHAKFDLGMKAWNIRNIQIPYWLKNRR